MENVIDIRNRIFEGDALIEQKKIPSNHVDMCFTSPPYWALRDYGITGQLGIEKDFNEYIEKLCNIFEETKRVLKKEGTLWVNINDTYNSHSANSKNVGGFEGRQMRNNEAYSKTKLTMKKVGVPDKSMFMIPERFAQEMINRGGI